MTSILDHQPPKIWPFPIKTGVIQVPGIDTYIDPQSTTPGRATRQSVAQPLAVLDRPCLGVRILYPCPGAKMSQFNAAIETSPLRSDCFVAVEAGG